MLVVCLSCKKQVEVKLIYFGNGDCAVCPKCGKLAYNAKHGWERPVDN